MHLYNPMPQCKYINGYYTVRVIDRLGSGSTVNHPIEFVDEILGLVKYGFAY